MSSTRRANKRARLARRAENDAMRTARRDSLAVLLARLARGIAPSAAEVALLRAAVEAEIAEGDAARLSERGQQRAMEQQRQRVEAAETAIVETEQRALAAEAAIVEAEDERDRQHDRAEQAIRRAVEEYDRRQAAEAALDRVRALAADMRTWCSPHGIATQYADDIERALAEQQVPRLATEQPRAADTVTVAPGVAVIHDRTAEERAEALLQRAEVIAADRDRLAAELEAAEERAAQARAEQQHVEAGDTAALRLAESSTRRWKERAEQAERALARVHRDAVRLRHAWESARRRAAEADERAAQAAADVEQMSRAHAVQQQRHDARRRDLADALGRSTGTAWPELVEHAAEAHESAGRAAVRADRKAAEQADAVTAETKRLMERRTTTLRTRAEQAEALAAARGDALAAHLARTRDTTEEQPEPVTLATPCANPECEHTKNWHTGTPKGVCVARGGACPCSRFEPPALDENDQEQPR